VGAGERDFLALLRKSLGQVDPIRPDAWNKLGCFFVPDKLSGPSHHFWGCDAHKRQEKGGTTERIIALTNGIFIIFQA
jgi:hypothetical protein